MKDSEGTVAVGVARIRLVIGDARNLKDKRRVVQSLKTRIRNEFNVSVAEVGHLDQCQSAVLAVAQVCNDGRYIRGTLDQVLNLIRRNPLARIVDYDFESY